jgi:hypothetical protein
VFSSQSGNAQHDLFSSEVRTRKIQGILCSDPLDLSFLSSVTSFKAKI